MSSPRLPPGAPGRTPISSSSERATNVCCVRYAVSAVSQAGLVNNAVDGLAWGILPLLFAAGGLSVQAIGVLAALYPGVWCVGQLFTGAWSDRVGRKPLITAGMILQGGALALMAATTGFGPWALGAVLIGVGTETLADFWAAALGYVTLGAAGSYVLLVAADGNQPKLLLQRVPEAKAVKNRMHLDIVTPDIHGEAARLEALGAHRVAPEAKSEHGSTWVLMEDPEGNEFCVCDGGAGGA